MKKIRTSNDPLFRTMEKDQMKKISGGLQNQSSQVNTYTVKKSGSADDGPDTLSPGEKQDGVGDSE